MSTNTLAPGKQADILPEGQKPSVILQQINVSHILRKTQEVIDWRNGVRQAEGLIPSRVLLYSLFFDVVQDAHVIATTGKRTDPITTAKWKYVDKDKKPVEAICRMCDSLGFAELIKEIELSKLWGYKMLFCNFFKDDEGFMQFSVEKVHPYLIRPEMGIVANSPYSNEGINIREGIYAGEFLEAGDVKDLGLLVSASLYAIYKRGGLGDLATFVEVFGQGILDATWDGFDESQRQKLSESLKDIGNGGVIIRPDGTKIELLQNTSSSDGKLHLGFLQFLNEEISKAIIGSTETTQSSKSSGYAQAEIHQEGDDNKVSSEIDYVRRVLNSRFKRILRAHGIDTMGGEFIIEVPEKQLTKKDAYTIHKSMKMDLKIPISDDFFYETYGVPKPDDYDAQKAALEAGKPDFEENDDPENPNNPAPTPPSKSDKKGKKPGKEDPAQGKKPGKLKRLYLEYKHFFG